MSDQPSITCPQCSMTSYHPTDIEMGWCGNCNGYTTPVNPLATAQRVVAAAEAEARARFVADTAAVDNLRTFTCEVCGGVFFADMTEEETNRELLASGMDTSSGLGSVCDACYQRAKDMGLIPGGGDA